MAVVCMMCVGCTGKRKAQSDVALVKETPSVVQNPEVTVDTLAVEEPDTETSTDTPSQPRSMVLEPVARDIPSGLPLSADSLSMRTEYDYYPVATSKVKVIITSRANREYDSGEGYSLVYYNEALKQWEPQPTSPIVNDVLWVFTPDYPTHTGRPFTSIRTRTAPAGIAFTNHSAGIHVRHTRSLNSYPRLSTGNCSTKLAGTGRNIPRTVS